MLYPVELRAQVRGFLERISREYRLYRLLMLVPLVGAVGFELTTLCSQSRCATRLRYAPRKRAFYKLASRGSMTAGMNLMTCKSPGRSTLCTSMQRADLDRAFRLRYIAESASSDGGSGRRKNDSLIVVPTVGTYEN